MIIINTVAPARMGMISRYSANTVPISVGVIAGCMRKHGKKVKIVDEQLSPFPQALQVIDGYLKEIDRPYIFGISCLTINIRRGLEIADLLREKYPDSKIIFGGIHATVLPEEVLSNPSVDIVVRGEGEQTMPFLYDAIKNNKDFSHIEGISFRDGSRIVHNPDRPLVDNLDDISFFPYEIFDHSKYNLGFVVSSRGCPFDCIFCSQRRISGRKYRFRSPEKVIQEIELLVLKYNQKFISFLDDDFLSNKERTRTLCDLLIKHKLHEKAAFGCQTRADNVDRGILSSLKQANFRTLGIGFETGSERLMQTIGKRETVADNIRAAGLIKEMGFNFVALFMFGLPSETKAERIHTYLLAKNLKIEYVKFNNVVPYPGTKLFEIAQKEGRLQIEECWQNFNSVGGIVNGIFSKSKLPYIPAGTTERQLKHDLIRANLYFYLTQPSIVLSLLKNKNPDWFSVSRKWYFDIREYYHLGKLGMVIFINALVVFDFQWFIQDFLGVFMRLRDTLVRIVSKDSCD